MKTIIAGCRWVNDPSILDAAIAKSGFTITEVISGGARGADALGEAWAKRHGVPLTVIRAEWERYGKSAGPRRNMAMLDCARQVIALWDGVSRGTGHLVREAEDGVFRLPAGRVYVHRVRPT